MLIIKAFLIQTNGEIQKIYGIVNCIFVVDCEREFSGIALPPPRPPPRNRTEEEPINATRQLNN